VLRGWQLLSILAAVDVDFGPNWLRVFCSTVYGRCLCLLGAVLRVSIWHLRRVLGLKATPVYQRRPVISGEDLRLWCNRSG
jgi:hypothetical protein